MIISLDHWLPFTFWPLLWGYKKRWDAAIDKYYNHWMLNVGEGDLWITLGLVRASIETSFLRPTTPVDRLLLDLAWLDLWDGMSKLVLSYWLELKATRRSSHQAFSRCQQTSAHFQSSTTFASYRNVSALGYQKLNSNIWICNCI